MTDFSTLALSAPVLRAVEEQGFTTTTEIQAATIPALLNGKDVIGIAQTGGGKTAAFVLPMIEKLMTYGDKPKPGMPRALILAPTRELALQISEAVRELSRHTPLKNCTIFGGAPYRTQIHILRRGVDILVATPGRLMDHMKQGNIYLDEAEYFVLDEADRMLDMGFVDDVRQIAAKMMNSHQSVMFSATMNHGIRSLAGTLLNEPEHIEVARESTVADNLTHKVLFVPYDKKYDLLLHLIKTRNVTKSLIFVRTKREADELSDFLADTGFNTDSIHGDKQQRMRERIIRGFKTGRTDFLVATDVAARGIDVKDIGHVFNIDVPVEAESYVHRIGRTARGGASGEAFTFCSKSEFNLLRAIERLIKLDIDVEEDHPFPLKAAYHNKGNVGGRPFAHKGGKRPFGDKKPYGSKKPYGAKKPHRGKSADGGWRPEREDTEGKGRAGGGKRRDGRDNVRFEGRKDDRFEGRRENRFEGRSENRSEDRNENRSEGKRGDFRKADGQRFEGRKSDGKKFEGKKFEGKKFSGSRTDRSDDRKPAGKRAEGAKPFAKRTEGKKPAGKKFGAGKFVAKTGGKPVRAKQKVGGSQPLRRKSA